MTIRGAQEMYSDNIWGTGDAGTMTIREAQERYKDETLGTGDYSNDTWGTGDVPRRYVGHRRCTETVLGAQEMYSDCGLAVYRSLPELSEINHCRWTV